MRNDCSTVRLYFFKTRSGVKNVHFVKKSERNLNFLGVVLRLLDSVVE